jgi:choline dehydrogenase-like flavoprotein
VLDTFFRPHGMKNLFVCDASVLPTATVVYPQLTIMALADVAAERMLHADA